MTCTSTGQLGLARTTVAAAVLLASTHAPAANRATVSPKELAAAINKADAKQVPYRMMRLSQADVRSVRCVGPEEPPTEFECKWQQRVKGGWVRRATWLAIDGTAWHVID